MTFSDKKLALPSVQLTASAAKRREMKRCDKKQEQSAKTFFAGEMDGRKQTDKNRVLSQVLHLHATVSLTKTCVVKMRFLCVGW